MSPKRDPLDVGLAPCVTPAPTGRHRRSPGGYDATVVLVLDPPAALGARMRVAVIVVPVRCPSTRTTVPTGKLEADPGTFLVPKTVRGVTVTVIETPLAVFTVHVPPLTAVTVPRTPGCLALAAPVPLAPPACPVLEDGGAAVAGVVAEDDDEAGDPDAVTA
jgi:hypothetical protein